MITKEHEDKIHKAYISKVRKLAEKLIDAGAPIDNGLLNKCLKILKKYYILSSPEKFNYIY